VPSDLFYGEICWIKLAFSHFETKFVWEVPLGLKISNFWVRHYLLSTKSLNKSVNRFVLWWHLLNKTEKKNCCFASFPIQVPRAKLRFEVLFKKFHRRIKLTTLFSTKLYLLNTIKPISGHGNRLLWLKQLNLKKPLIGGYPLEPEFQNSEYKVHQVGPKVFKSQNFSFLAIKG
jgi:hypothetical protein